MRRSKKVIRRLKTKQKKSKGNILCSKEQLYIVLQVGISKTVSYYYYYHCKSNVVESQSRIVRLKFNEQRSFIVKRNFL